MKELMTADTSHVLRRPGIGLFEFAGSLSSAIDMLSANADHCGWKHFTVGTTRSEVQRDEAETRRHISTLQTFLTHDQGRFREFSIKVAICTSRLFVGVLSALQVSTAFKNPQWWAERRPTKCMQGTSNRKSGQMIHQTSAAFAKHYAQFTRLKQKKKTHGKEEETTLQLIRHKKRRHWKTTLRQNLSRNAKNKKNSKEKS